MFSSPVGYSYAAFHQATLVHEELSAFEDPTFGELVDYVGRTTALCVDVVSLLYKVADQRHIGAIFLTCGLKHQESWRPFTHGD